MTQNDYLPIAVRAYAEPLEPDGTNPQARRRRRQRWPRLRLVFDCETTTDPRQRLTFGVYRVYRDNWLLDEGIFYDPDAVDVTEVQTIRNYTRQHVQDSEEYSVPLSVRTREEFLRKVFFTVAHYHRGAVVGFNLPFDLSRLACQVGNAHGWYTGGFSFTYRTYTDNEGRVKPDIFTPRIAIKTLDSKGAFIGFTQAITDDAQAKYNDLKQPWRGRFLDLRTLAFALTDTSHTLESACAAFGVGEGKQTGVTHGTVTPEYLDYARQDVRITDTLYRAIMAEYAKHPVRTPPDKLFTPASIGKAYLDAFGIRTPKLTVQPACNVTEAELMGYAMASYYGGRAECRIRGYEVPVRYCDFRSMYPTVNTLMGLWEYLTASYIHVALDTERVQAFLDTVTLNDLFRPETWRELPVLVELIPDGDILPIRSQYGDASDAYTIGVNPLTTPVPMYYTLAGCVDSKLLSGKTPRIRRAFRFTPRGKQGGLRPVALRDEIVIDPRQDDFFREVIRARHAVKHDRTRPEAEREALQQFLKTLANSTSYGVFVELNRQDGDRRGVRAYGRETFDTTVEHYEQPGKLFFPPLATWITSGARLMLALAETAVRERGGWHTFMDTDSIAIVACEHGGLLACPGGDARMPDGREAIKVLSWADVEQIRARFKTLNPYGDGESILELEDENFDGTGKQQELLCYAVAAKRYVIYNRDGTDIVIRKPSEHALGVYLPPHDPETGAPVTDFIDQAWAAIVRSQIDDEPFELPGWADQPATTRLSISTPTMRRWFARWNTIEPENLETTRKPYAEQVKPFNFLHHVARMPRSLLPANIPATTWLNLVAPYGERDGWVNLHNPTGSSYGVQTENPIVGIPDNVVVWSYESRIVRHHLKDEPKSLGPDGQPCTPHTRGLLRRRPVRAGFPHHVGKEANDLEKVQAGLVDLLDDVMTTYERSIADDVARVFGEMETRVIQSETGHSRSQVKAIRNGKAQPKSDRLPVAVACAARVARARLIEMGYDDTGTDADAVRLYADYLRRRDGDDAMVRARRRAERQANRELRNAILFLGGIAPHRDGSLRTEYQSLPRRLRKRTGSPPDDIAHSLGQMYPEFGITDEHDLYAALS